MRLPSSENFRWYSMVVGLAAVLVLLAVLQYRSGKAVKEATSQQMRASLQGSLMDVREGLQREITPLCRELQSGSDTSRQGLQEYQVRFERWRRAAAHPNLVDTVFVWQQNDSGHNQLFKLNANRSAFEPGDWPENLSKLQKRLIEMGSDPGVFRDWHGGPGGMPDSFADGQPPPPGGPGAQGPPPDGERGFDGAHEPRGQGNSSDRFGNMQRRPPPLRSGNQVPPPPNEFGFSSLWMIDESIPALIHPFRESLKPGPPGMKPATLNWIVVVLDRRVLGQHILPELVERYFGSNELSSYEIAVVDCDAKSSELYSSDPGFNRRQGFLADATLNLFGRPVPIVSGRPLISGGIAGIAPPNPASKNTANGPNDYINSTTGFHNDEEMFRIEPFQYPGAKGVWEVVAEHREGSVDAAVRALARRNLMFNFAVLLVLAATMGMIIATSARARRLGRLQMDFVTNISHELRTPLTGIISAGQNIADGLIDDKERAARYGKAIIGQAHQLSDLVEQILLFSATQKGRHRYHLQPVEVGEVISSSLKSMDGLIRSEGVTVEQDIQPNLPVVMADVRALSQCLQNLIGNAVKYGGDGRWVGIRALAESSGGEKQVSISVADRGIGISREDLDHIFEAFYRSPEVTAAQIHGSGLGLPLAKTIAEEIGGRLTVQSELGKGSTFTLHLPVK